MTVYLHAGFPKAASSTLQRFLSTNVDVLAQHGLLYPLLFADRGESGGANPRAHNALALELRHNDHRPAGGWEKLRAVVSEAPAGNDMLLSGENFMPVEPSTLRDALGDLPAKLIFYVRDQARSIPSIYAHRTYTGVNADDFDAFFAAVDHPYLNLPNYFARWARVFGADKIAVRLLDRRVLVHGDVRLDLLEAVGLVPPRLDVQGLTMTTDGNVSPGWKALEILRSLHAAPSPSTTNEAGRSRRRNPMFEPQLWLGARRLEKNLGLYERGQYLTDEQFALCAERFDAQVDALEAMGLDTRLAHTSRDGFTPRAFLPTIDHVPPDEKAAFLARLFPDGIPAPGHAKASAVRRGRAAEGLT